MSNLKKLKSWRNLTPNLMIKYMEKENFDYQAYEFKQSEEEFNKLLEELKLVNSLAQEVKALNEGRASPWYKNNYNN